MTLKLNLATLVIFSFLIIGCSSVDISGDSRADNTLKSDVSRKLSLWAKTETKCEKVDSIQTQILKTNPIGTGDSVASKRYGSIEEKWVVNLCGQNIPFSVIFTPDGQGGTYFRTSREKNWYPTNQSTWRLAPPVISNIIGTWPKTPRKSGPLLSFFCEQCKTLPSRRLDRIFAIRAAG